ncbi:MAG TPA: hypothetical protein VMQ59_01895 [Acidimicrobiales bacterium]|jgi:catechol 2,3-dioxygenase-like lactoylglutathione lyase family enzyme|nr:hypothetical protein [Acidimicrobiales bacterium]
MSTESPVVTAGDGILGFDHVALPMRENEAMIRFYRALGLEVAEFISYALEDSDDEGRKPER